MIADYQSGSNGSSAVNSGDAFYNYFQFLDMNSSTNYTGSELDDILESKISSSSSKLLGTGELFVKYQNEYSVNALLSLGIAVNESAWGTSSICMNKNNLFGLNAVDTSPGQSANYFASVEDCIREFMSEWMADGYLSSSDWRNHGEYLGNKAAGINVSYASDPYWGEKAAAIAWELDEAGGSHDYLGISSGNTDDSSSDNTEVPKRIIHRRSIQAHQIHRSRLIQRIHQTAQLIRRSRLIQRIHQTAQLIRRSRSDTEDTSDSTTDTQEPSDTEDTSDSTTDTQKPSDTEDTSDSTTDTQEPSDTEDTSDSTTDTQEPSDTEDTSDSTTDTQEPSDTEDKNDSDEKPETEQPSVDDETSGTADTTEEQKPSETTDTIADQTSEKDEEQTMQNTANTQNAENNSSADKETVNAFVNADYGIKVSGVKDGSMTVRAIEPNTDEYDSYVSVDPVKGKEILGAYDITVSGTMDGKAQLTSRSAPNMTEETSLFFISMKTEVMTNIQEQ